MKKLFAILRTGKFTDSAGKEHEFTEQDLDKIAENYNSGKDEAPIVVGHPKTNSPAFGWIKSLKRVGDKLFAEPKQLNEDFAELVKKGTYKKISVSLYPDKKLRHVGFLGGAAPAVKGLPAVEFSGEAEESFEFDYEAEKPDKPSIDLSEIKKTISELESKITQLAQSAKGSSVGKAELPDDFAERLSAIESENSKLKTKLKVAEFGNYLDERIEKGKLTPGQKEKALELFEFISSAESYDFSEKGEQSPEKVFREFLETFPTQIDFSEFGEKGNEELTDREKALAVIRANMS